MSVEQTSTVDENYRTCIQCGQRFTGHTSTCGTTGCIPKLTEITEFSPCEPYVVKKPIKVKITNITTDSPIYLN